jgi:hypothetical protein
MGKKEAKKEGAKKDKKAKEVDPATRPQKLREAKGAFQHNEQIIDVVDGPCPGGTIAHVRGGTSDAALGSKTLTAGRHRWCVSIDKTANGSAYGIVIGVADATPGVAVTDVYGGAAWGIHTTTSRFVTTLDCYERGLLGEPLMPAERDGSRGLKGCAAGGVVFVDADLDNRTLSIAVNDSQAVRAPVRLPAAVRAWVLLSWEGDQVTMFPPMELAPSHGAGANLLG